MSVMMMGAIESRFADMIWQNEPVTSPELVKLAAQELNWKKSTTYTVLRKLCERGIFKNADGAVTSLMTKDEFRSIRSEQFVDEAFAGSLPAFIAAFTKRKSLSDAEIAELRTLIENSKK